MNQVHELSKLMKTSIYCFKKNLIFNLSNEKVFQSDPTISIIHCLDTIGEQPVNQRFVNLENMNPFYSIYDNDQIPLSK